MSGRERAGFQLQVIAGPEPETAAGVFLERGRDDLRQAGAGHAGAFFRLRQNLHGQPKRGRLHGLRRPCAHALHRSGTPRPVKSPALHRVSVGSKRSERGGVSSLAVAQRGQRAGARLLRHTGNQPLLTGNRLLTRRRRARGERTTEKEAPARDTKPHENNAPSLCLLGPFCGHGLEDPASDALTRIATAKPITDHRLPSTAHRPLPSGSAFICVHLWLTSPFLHGSKRSRASLRSSRAARSPLRGHKKAPARAGALETD